MKHVLFLLLLSTANGISMEKSGPTSPYITLESNQGTRLSISLEALKYIPTLNDAIQCAPDNVQLQDQVRVIPFDDLELDILIKLANSFLKYQKLKGKALLDAVSKAVPVKQPLALLVLADKLNSNQISQAAAHALALQYKDSPKQELFNLTNQLHKKLSKDPADYLCAQLARYNFLLNGKYPNFITQHKFHNYSLEEFREYQPQEITKRMQNNNLDLQNLDLSDIEKICEFPGITASLVKSLTGSFNPIGHIPILSSFSNITCIT